MESVMENGTYGASQKKTVTESVTEYMIYSVVEKRHGKRHLWSVTKIVTQAASRKCVMESIMECVMS